MISILVSGFVNNFVSASLGTLLMDVTILVAFASALALLLHRGRVNLQVTILLLALLLFSGMVFIKAVVIDSNSLEERLLGTRNYVIYLLPVLIPFALKYRHIKSLTVWTMRGGAVICLFAIAQFVLRSSLPRSLLQLNVETNLFGFYGTDLVRSNGLVGNTIIFTGFTLTIAVLGQAMWLAQRSGWALLAWVGGLLGMAFTFSRAGWVAAAGGTMLVFVLHYRTRLIPQFLIAFATIGAIVGAGVWLADNPRSFVARRLTGTEVTTQGSTEVHAQQIADSIHVLRSTWPVGVGVGTQGTSATGKLAIITDGWLFQAPLELGLPIAALLLLAMLSLSIYALFIIINSRHKLTRVLAIAVLTTTLYYIASGTVNSAYVGKTTYALYWLIAGLLLSATLKQKSSPELDGG